MAYRPDQRSLLSTLRREAGFKSAKAAAENFGWAVGTYTSHETGLRSADASTLERYTVAFRSVAERPRAPDTYGAGSRLLVARRLRGFRTAAAFISRFGWTKSTYHAHEAGRNEIELERARDYATALGISAAWLREALGPSGLGDGVDKYIADRGIDRRGYPPSEHDLQPLLRYETADYAKRHPPADLPTKVFAMASLEGRDAVVLHERPWTKKSLDSHSKDSKGAIWALDASLLKQVWRAEPAGLRMLVVDSNRFKGLARSGDRLVVDVAERDRRPGQTFVTSGARGELGLSRDDGKDPILGRVILRIGYG